MTNLDWERLRDDLLVQFDEDTTQQAIANLLETQDKGAVVLDPLRWCRKAAARLMKNEYRRRDRERAGKETLSALKIPLDNRSTKNIARDKKRRQRRRRIANG